MGIIRYQAKKIFDHACCFGRAPSLEVAGIAVSEEAHYVIIAVVTIIIAVVTIIITVVTTITTVVIIIIVAPGVAEVAELAAVDIVAYFTGSRKEGIVSRVSRIICGHIYSYSTFIST